MKEIYNNLSWLVSKESQEKNNFLKDLNEVDSFIDLIRFCNFQFSDLQVDRLQEVFFSSLEDLNFKIPKDKIVKLLIISNNTSDFIKPHLQVAGLRLGLYIDIEVLPYGNIISLLLEGIDSGGLSGIDYTLLSLNSEDMYLKDSFQSKSELEGILDQSLETVLSISDIISNNLKSTLIYQPIENRSENIFGTQDSSIDGTIEDIVSKLNKTMRESLKSLPDIYFDTQDLIENIGKLNWKDHKLYHWAKIPFNPVYNGIYSHNLANLIVSNKGLSKKCLVLDLDNTLWGGVIGDDGIDGIKLNQGDPIGESFLSFQSYCKRLKDRGIILAVSSKNSYENAVLPFKEHPDTVLKEEDFIVFKANWENKADNIRQISEELNIGLDSLVFVDDNPVERNLVREFLPEVSVPELSQEVSSYSETIAIAGYFESNRFSQDDLNRVTDYQSNISRKKLQNTSIDLSSYLNSLKMSSQVSEVSLGNLTRPTQLILKTNQFNLTNLRRTEKEIEDLINSEKYAIFQYRLSDKFSDNGIVSVVILEIDGNFCRIDSWVMSCRVFGRTFEHFISDHITSYAKERGCTSIQASYVPSKKNIIVERLYEELGYMREKGSEKHEFLLNLEEYINLSKYIDSY